MFKNFTKWLETKDQAARQAQYDNGYGYAAAQLLVHKNTPHDDMFDVTIFDRGIQAAVRDIADLQAKAKKLEIVEKENKDLREIVRKMQTELQQLLEQIPMQALGNTKLPFRVEELPEWANWIAQDADGEWWAFTHEPSIEGDRWYTDDCIPSGTLRLCSTPVSADWRSTKTYLSLHL